MVEINWTIITYFVIGLFALAGFFKGWWKEAITTFFLCILVFFLKFPDIAAWFIDKINDLLQFLWDWLSFFFVDILGIDQVPQFDASDGGTWIIILVLFLALSIIIGRGGLPNQIGRIGRFYIYPVTPTGSFLGGLLGGLNGFLIINLMREYLTGSNLPTGNQLPTEIAAAAGQTVGVASSGVGFTLTDLPTFTALNNPLVWIIIGFGAIIALLTLKNRAIVRRLRIAEYRAPWGYRPYRVVPAPPPPKT